MKRHSIVAVTLFSAVMLLLPVVAQQPAQEPPGGKKGGAGKGKQPPVQPKPEELKAVQSKADEIGAIVKELKAKMVDPDLIADVEVYEKAGRFLLEFPETFFTQAGIDQALSVLDKGIERARQLQSGQSPWVAQKGRKILGYYSPLDGSVQPMGLTVPASYDGTKSVRLYIWLHGRSQPLSEANFIFTNPNAPGPNSSAYTADAGQITIDAYGRWNNANHWAGEVDVYESIAAVQRRYKIDPSRIILRGFSLGGAGAWHIALHNPSKFVAADIGAGTWPRRLQIAEQQPQNYPYYQRAALRIWENILDWALNAHNLPLAGHSGDADTQIASIPGPPPGSPTRGQLESSIRVREQLAKEGYPSEGDPDFMRAKGTPAMFLISLNTGHAVSQLSRQRIDAFLKEWGDKGQTSPEHIRFLSYTTRYNTSYWVSFDGLEKHYERAELDAVRSDGGTQYQIKTKNLTRLTLRETSHAAQIDIDGQKLKVKSAASITLEKVGSNWKVAGARWAGLHKTHALQGPIDDAFLDPFLLVRPTGPPWSAEQTKHALRILAQFDRTYARWYRAHPRIKNDEDVTSEDFAKYNVVLFGDPGSNRWIAKIASKLPLKWTREALTVGAQSFPAGQHLPALVYPNPLRPTKYVVVNSGLTIAPNEYQADYSMPRIGDFAVLRIKEDVTVPDPALAGLFDESWQLPNKL